MDEKVTSTVSNDDISREVRELGSRVDSMSRDVTLIKNSLLGSLDNPDAGYTFVIRDNTRRITTLESRYDKHETTREKLVAQYDDRVTALERWVDAMRNRAIGIAIGIGLGSAGIGAAVASLISALFNG